VEVGDTLNHLCLVGRLTKDVEIKTYDTKKGKGKIATYTLAVSNTFKRGEADFITCQSWGASATFLEKYSKKSSRIEFEGRVSTSMYKHEGKNMKGTIMVSTQVNVLFDSKSDTNTSDTSGNDTSESEKSDEEPTEDKPF